MIVSVIPDGVHIELREWGLARSSKLRQRLPYHHRVAVAHWKRLVG